jgi:mRNA interferase MazF
LSSRHTEFSCKAALRRLFHGRLASTNSYFSRWPEVGRGDFLICQITSKQYGDLHVLPLNESDFVSGGIKRDSFIRVFKLFTGSEALILGVAGQLTHSKLSEVIGQLVEMLSPCLRDDTF